MFFSEIYNHSGVPQVGYPGPLLFIPFIYDFAPKIKHLNCLCNVDDLNILTQIHKIL